MLNAHDHFKRLADKFEALVLEIGISNNDPERRLELLQRLKVLTDDMDELVLTSLSRHTETGVRGLSRGELNFCSLRNH